MVRLKSPSVYEGQLKISIHYIDVILHLDELHAKLYEEYNPQSAKEAAEFFEQKAEGAYEYLTSEVKTLQKLFKEADEVIRLNDPKDLASYKSMAAMFHRSMKKLGLSGILSRRELIKRQKLIAQTLKSGNEKNFKRVYSLFLKDCQASKHFSKNSLEEIHNLEKNVLQHTDSLPARQAAALEQHAEGQILHRHRSKIRYALVTIASGIALIAGIAGMKQSPNRFGSTAAGISATNSQSETESERANRIGLEQVRQRVRELKDKTEQLKNMRTEKTRSSREVRRGILRAVPRLNKDIQLIEQDMRKHRADMTPQDLSRWQQQLDHIELLLKRALNLINPAGIRQHAELARDLGE